MNDLLSAPAKSLFEDSLLATIHDSLVILDKDMRIRLANNVFYEVFHVHPGDLEGQPLFEVNGGQWNIPALRKQLESMAAKNTSFNNFEVRLTLSDKTEKILLLNATIIPQQTESEPFILLAISDVTESVHLKKAINQNTEELKHANELLHQKNKDFERINKELESFAYVSSHDLKEPLRIIRSFANIIAQKEIGNLTETGKEYFGRIQSAVNRMQNLIDDLLIYSRTVNSEKKFAETDLNALFGEVKSTLIKTIAEKNAVIEDDIHCKVNVISLQFNQLLQNLLHNALKFSKPDVSPHIIVKCKMASGKDLSEKNLLPDINYCHLIFKDNGIGFEQEYSERIFEVFKTLHSKEKYGGTGIGLAIVKKIVENHNGLITATSELNKGAQFDLYIPQP